MCRVTWCGVARLCRTPHYTARASETSKRGARGASVAKSVAVRVADPSVPPSVLVASRSVSVRRSSGECVSACCAPANCGVLRGDDGRARRSAGGALRVAVRDGAAGRGGHVRARRRQRAAPGHAVPGPARPEAPGRPVLRRAAGADPRHGALPDARHLRRLRLAAAQEVPSIQRQEDQGPRQDQDGVHRQQAAEVHHVLQAEDRDYEEGGSQAPARLLAIFHVGRPVWRS